MYLHCFGINQAHFITQEREEFERENWPANLVSYKSLHDDQGLPHFKSSDVVQRAAKLPSIRFSLKLSFFRKTRQMRKSDLSRRH